MARTPSSRPAVLLAFLLAGPAAAAGQESAKSIPVPSIAAATLPVTGSTAGPAISGDISSNVGETTISASAKVSVVGGLGAELSVQTAQPSGSSGALVTNGDSIASGAQVGLALTYGNYDLLPDSDPGVQAMDQARRNCGALSASKLREKVKVLNELREKQKKNVALEEGEQEKVAAADQAGCTYSDDAAYWLVERSRFKPFLAAVKATLGRSNAVYLEDGTYLPTSDLIRGGVSVAIGQYLTSGMLVAGSFRWISGNVVGGGEIEVCHQIDVDTSGNPVTQCETGIPGTPVRGNLFRVALELRHLVGNGLIWAPASRSPGPTSPPPRSRPSSRSCSRWSPRPTSRR